MSRRPPVFLPAALLVIALAAPALAAWDLPAAGSCQPGGGVAGGPGAKAGDVPAQVPFASGDAFALEQLPTLQRFLPEFLWQERERFFFEGMRLEIGPCFADYAPPGFFRDATAAGAGRARLTAEGGLEGYGAGLPFPPESISADDPQAGDKWLWNVQHRYQAAGFRGKFRMTDLVGRTGRAEPFEGELFKLLLAHRADRPQDGYRAAGGDAQVFAAGGLFVKPFDAKEFAWRQYRDEEVATDGEYSDELHGYIPGQRRVRRINSARVEGLYMPSFSVGVQTTQQLLLGGSSPEGGGIGAVGTSAAGAEGTIQTKRSGWEGLELRPILYRTKVLGTHDVLAPIDATAGGWPTVPDRNFGPWGLSFANDRWDLRRALVLEMTAKRPGVVGDSEIHARQILYVDLQTLQPLYVATFDAKNEMTNVGQYAYRWSEEREGYPRWPDDPKREVRVLDSVGAAFANLAESGSWRRESWENVATPPSDAEVKRMISVSQLTKRR
jgi:hypothetical protein